MINIFYIERPIVIQSFIKKEHRNIILYKK